MRTKSIIVSVSVFFACAPQPETKVTTVKADAASMRADGAVENRGTIALTVSSATRHLPGTLIVNSDKYYLVQGDGTVRQFATSALVTASGYAKTASVAVSDDEMSCYASGERIISALAAPPSGRLRDGMLVKEKGKIDTYVISDGVAWPVINGNVFTAAGYDFANVVEIAAGSLAKQVEAVGNCVTGIACLDDAFLHTCAREDLGAVGTVAGGAADTDTATGTGVPVTEGVLRHLPGTVVTTATGKYYYLVGSNGEIAPFADAELVSASGYSLASAVKISADELHCYRRAGQITVALPSPPSGRLRDGMLVKEKGKSDTYVISEGMAWPVISGAVFSAAGYDFANVVEIAAGSLAKQVETVGNCAIRVYCLDDAYLRSCAEDDLAPVVTDTATSTGTATSVDTVSTSSVTSVATKTPVATATQTHVQSTATATSVITETFPVTATATATSTVTTTSAVQTVASTVTATQVQTQTATAPSSSASPTTVTTGVTTATSSETNNQQLPTIDLSWAWDDVSSKLCLNAAYFAGGKVAVLLVWEGPGADPRKGTVSTQGTDRFCWDFSAKAKGLYRFWADVPDSTCATASCSRDADENNGAMYMRAPKVKDGARRWLYCPTETSGCDGMAYWDGVAFTPMGN